MAWTGLARLLRVKKEEEWIVSKLFWIQFFQGASVAFFFTTAYATFIHDHEASDLSVIYIYSSVLLWAAGFIYNKLEHKYHVTKFSRYVTVFMAITIICFRLIGFTTNFPGFEYLLFIWFNVLYLLSNLEFWGIAALVFEVRQSKRLFGIISAGDIPAKFVGYSVASIVAPYTGTPNLLIPSFICMLLSLPFLRAIAKSGLLHTYQNEHKHVHSSSEGLFRTILKRFTGNGLILSVAILAFIMAVGMTIANFAFYSKIKEYYHSDVEFAVFIASFLALVQLSALMVKLFVTGKLISEMGLRRALLLTPFIFFVCIILVIILPKVFNGQELVLYLFGITCIILDVLKMAINSPVFLSIMQPLPIHDRLRAHNIVKGIMDPFAYLFAGLFLFTLVDIEKGVELETLSYWLLLFTIFWMVAIYFTDRSYYKTVLQAITSKFYIKTDITIDDANTVTYIQKKLRSGSEEQVIHILRLLQFRNTSILDENLLHQLLTSGSSKIKEELLLLHISGGITIPERLLKEMLENVNLDKAIRIKAFSVLCNTNPNEEIIFRYTNENDADFKCLALGNILKNEHFNGYAEVKNIIQNLLHSTNASDRLAAVKAIAVSGVSDYNDNIISLINDSAENVGAAAIEAAGNLGNENLITAILSSFTSKRKVVTNALLKASDNALPHVCNFILTAGRTETEKKQLINLCGLIGGENAVHNLCGLLKEMPENTHVIVKALANSIAIVKQTNQPLFETLAHKLIEEAVEILHYHEKLHTDPEKYKLLITALDIELLQIRESLLNIFSFLYVPEEIDKVRKSFALDNKEQTANALEMVEISVPKKYAHDFAVIYETGDITSRCARLHTKKNLKIKSAEEIPDALLHTNGIHFLYWTKACALYTAYKNNISINETLVKKYVQSEYPVLQNISNHIIHPHMENNLLLLEKVLILKSTEIFAETPENILADLATLMQETVYAEGTLIFEEGTIGDSMYIIYQGSVRIHKGNTTLTVLDKENEVFGELSLFDSEKRSASATAHTDCFLFKIDQLPFYELIETRPEILRGAVKILCNRLRLQNERTVALQLHV